MWRSRFDYLKVLLKHKWYVFLAGVRLGGIPLWRLIIHDWSKFGLWEFDRYAANFHGDYTVSAVDRDHIDEEFAIGWLHHENLNPHHVGYWIPRTGQYADTILRMPDTFVREMVADMQGASVAYTGSPNMEELMNSGAFARVTSKLHEESTIYLHEVLAEIGYVMNLVPTDEPKQFKMVWKRDDNKSC